MTIDIKKLQNNQSNIILHALLTLEDAKSITHTDVKELMNILYGKVTIKSDDWKTIDKECIPVHLSHCYQGEYSTTCKYGQDENCPANPKRKNK